MTNLIGQSLGRYHILEQLGEGGMATVYKAFDTRLERDVAVKIIRKKAFPEEQLERILKRFEREAMALARLSHPNILKVLDYGEHEGSPYLVLEYIQGGTLKEKLKGKTIPWQEAVRNLIPIANALEYAHEHGIVHRDVKPSNILLTDKGQSLLSDFGIAKILEVEESATLTGTGVGVGTPEYMAPEQWTGNATAQSDIYSLGIVLYEMVTGRKPYTADTPAAILLKQATEPLPRPSTFVNDLPDSIEKILLKALARKPENRYEDMQSFIRALGAVGNQSTPQKKVVPLKSADTQTTYIQDETNSTRFQSATYDDQSRQTRTPPATPQPKKMLWWPWAVGIGGAVCLGFAAIFGGSLFARNLTSSAPEVLAVPSNSNETAEPQSTFTSSPQTSSNDPAAQAQPGLPSSTPLPTYTSLPTYTLQPTFTLPAPPTSKPSASNPSGKIVFTCQISGDENFNEICIINADGSGYKQLTNNGANNGWPSISPDGSTVLFSSNVLGTWQIYSISPNGQSQRQLTFDPDEAFAPDMSPNGQIVYKKVSTSSVTDMIWVMDSNGGGAYKIYGNGWDPVWSADGSKILFASGELKAPQLFISNASGSGVTQLTNTSEIRGRSDWSPQNLVAFYAGPSWQRNLYTIGADGSNLTQITDGGNSQGPSFSPDGEWIALTGYYDNMGNTSGCEIYIVRTDGSDRKQLTSNSYCDWQPRWGP